MSKLADTQAAYDKLAALLDQEMRKRQGGAADLEKIRDALNVAFYLLGWAQFEYLVREEAAGEIDRQAATHQLERLAWEFMKENVKSVTVRKRLDIIFHTNRTLRKELDKDYNVRNEAAHNYKQLPKEAKDISVWIGKLEDLVSKF